MQLIGMLDSPYVRRVAISLRLLVLPFELRQISLFREVERFRSFNPVLKAPTLICLDGQRLMDSSLILDYAQHLACGSRQLLPSGHAARATALSRSGLALALSEKAVQLLYERDLRPAEKRHAPWQQRVEGQLRAACGALDKAWLGPQPPLGEDSIGQDAIDTAVAWTFLHFALPELIERRNYPTLEALTAEAEALSVFRDYPVA